MSWYKDPSGTNHTNRWSVYVDNNSSGAVDVTISVPATHPLWDVCQSDGDDVRVCDPKGNLLAYDLNGFSYANRTVTLRVDGYTAPAAQPFQLFVYAGNAAATSASVVVAIASAKTGYIEECAPPAPVFVYARERFQDERPRAKLAKGADEIIGLTVDFGNVLRRRVAAYAGHRQCEEISYITTAATGPTISTARYAGGRYVSLLLAGGTHGTDYTITVTCYTTEGAVFVHSIWLAVRTVDEA